MTSIDASQRLAAALRNEVTAFRERARAARTLAHDKPGDARQHAGAFAGPLAQRIGAIAPDDPQRTHKAFRVFLETALLEELGQGLIHDASFPTMVEDVHARMQQDPELAGAAEELASYLLGKATGNRAPPPARSPNP